MRNNFFRFKQFIIHQEKCAMKVCTDACLFGGWAAHGSGAAGRNLLDIGTGTGLLALMFAQKNPDTIIDAVEIDKSAAEQAKENFERSPWKERLHAYNLSIQEFALTPLKKYDVIISNPPFYENELNSEDQKRNLALHSAELNLEGLIAAVDKLLIQDGNFFVLLPYHRTKYFEQIATRQNLFIKEKIFVKQTPKHDYFRSMLRLTRKNETTERTEIIIADGNAYTGEFTKLMKDYYQHL